MALVDAALACVRRGAYRESIRFAERALIHEPWSAYAAHRVCGASLLVLDSAPERAVVHTEAALAMIESARDDFADVVGALNDVALARSRLGQDGAASLRRGLYAARRAFRPSPELARATLLHMDCVSNAVDLLPESWLSFRATLWDVPCVLVTASTRALRHGDTSDAAYYAQLAVEAAHHCVAVDYVRRPFLVGLARAQKAACDMALRHSGHDVDVPAARAALHRFATVAPSAQMRKTAQAHLQLEHQNDPFFGFEATVPGIGVL